MDESGFRTIGAVATELGLPRWQLAYRIERGDLPGPSAQVPGRRLFSAADIERLRAALATLSNSTSASDPTPANPGEDAR
jgi:DNA-binding transcriptional MerR regulator